MLTVSAAASATGSDGEDDASGATRARHRIVGANSSALSRKNRSTRVVKIAESSRVGIAMVNQTVFYIADIGLPIDTSQATTLMFVIVGSHLVMVSIGVLWLGLLLLRALGGQDTSRHRDLVSAAALYWYAATAIYAVIWIGIYIAK